MKRNLIILMTFLSLNSFGQNDKLIYKPILNTSLEESFPNAAAILVASLKIGIEQFDYGKKNLKSTWYEYYRGINRHRCKFLFSIDDNNTLDIKAVEIQWWVSSKSYWDPTTEGLFSKKEEKIRAVIAEATRKNIENSEITKQNQNWFFKDLGINTLFFENATDLAGDRWFEMYLKDKNVRWNLTFVDIEKNTNSNNDCKYKEIFIYSTTLTLASIDFERSKFYIVKYTNDDNNVLTQKGDKKELTGYCRTLDYDNGKFYISVTDNLDDILPQESEKIENSNDNQKSILEVADKLKQLKELLDMGVITESEFKAEKEKLLNGQ